MAYDAEPGGDPRGPWCKRCKTPILQDQASTWMHVQQDPDGKLGLTGLWHAECARPHWDTMTPILKRFGPR